MGSEVMHWVNRKTGEGILRRLCGVYLGGGVDLCMVGFIEGGI